MAASPFLITTYGPTFLRTGWIGNAEDITLLPMHNAIGSATFTLPADHPRVPDLMLPGARAVITYSDTTSPTVEDIVVGGPVTAVAGKGPAATAATVTFTIEDDYRVMSRILGWPNPGESIFNQGYDDDGEELGDYHRIQGPAETVVKGFVASNNPRLGLPITIAPDLGRGDDIDVRMRFQADFKPLARKRLVVDDQRAKARTVRGGF